MYCKLCNFRLPSEVDAVEKFELIDNKSGQHVEPKTVLQLKDIDPFEDMVAIRIIYPPIPSHLLHAKKNNFFLFCRTKDSNALSLSQSCLQIKLGTIQHARFVARDPTTVIRLTNAPKPHAPALMQRTGTINILSHG